MLSWGDDRELVLVRTWVMRPRSLHFPDEEAVVPGCKLSPCGGSRELEGGLMTRVRWDSTLFLG